MGGRRCEEEDLAGFVGAVLAGSASVAFVLVGSFVVDPWLNGSALPWALGISLAWAVGGGFMLGLLSLLWWIGRGLNPRGRWRLRRMAAWVLLALGGGWTVFLAWITVGNGTEELDLVDVVPEMAAVSAPLVVASVALALAARSEPERPHERGGRT